MNVKEISFVAVTTMSCLVVVVLSRKKNMLKSTSKQAEQNTQKVVTKKFLPEKN